MFLVRRTFKVKTGTSRKAAEILTRIGKMYEAAGQRGPSRLYISGGTVPGPANTVYMDWVEDALRSPYREDNPAPPEESDLFAELSKYQEETSIEFFEMHNGA